jgi:DNA mismatch repair protein MutL
MVNIHKLDDELIDHIAAGEVVERPASVLKELLDNSIDAGATNITVSVEDGGIGLLEVSDDGSGMSREDLKLSVESHTTSKINSIDDLSKITTLGFRGEALSSISAVSKLKVSSKSDGDKIASEFSVEGGKKSELKSTSRDIGTTISVESLFFNVPARRKFLKTPQTEYRKILEKFIPIALINPQIHFILRNNRKEVYNLPRIKEAKSGTLHPQRVNEIIKGIEFLDLFYDGEGITVGGQIGHPRHQSNRISHRYIFVNGRPIWDSGIAKAVSMGTNRFVPDGAKAPFIVSLNLSVDQVDVNVHPQKIEVRFANPYRVYSAVERAVKEAYEDSLGAKKSRDDVEFARLRDSSVVSKFSDSSGTESADLDSSVGEVRTYGVKDSLEFSKIVLEDSGEPVPEEQERYSDMQNYEFTGARQFMNRYIVVSVDDELWIVDQHAAAERVRFEKLLAEYSDKSIQSQKVMVPVEVNLSEPEKLFIDENEELMSGLGFEFKIGKDVIEVTAIPVHLMNADHATLFRDFVGYLSELEDFEDTDKKLSGKLRDSVIVTLACHSSVRMNKKISDSEASAILKDLFKCDNAYSCPHGRPIIWKVSSSEIDKQFSR